MISRKGWITAILLVASLALMAGCTGPSTVRAGDNVSVDYIGWYDNGTIFDTSIASVAQEAGIYNVKRTYSPMSFIAGKGQVISGFDNATIGMKVGDSKNVSIAPEEAYGAYDPSLILPLNMSVLTASNITPYVNQTLYNAYGQAVRVDSIPNNTTVMIDYNDPMAGKTLNFKITVRDVKAVNST